MRHLVVCCDGTWNTPEQEQGGVPTPTNVVRLHHALIEDSNQLRYYHPGVGTDPGLVDLLRGGGMAECSCIRVADMTSSTAVRQAVILAGGEGSRLKPYTDAYPKPMVEIAGRCIIDHQIEWLAEAGVTDVVVAAGYLHEVLIEHLRARRQPLRVTTVVEDQPLGRGGGLKYAGKHLRAPADAWYALNGDIWTRFDLPAMAAYHTQRHAVATIALARPRLPWGVVEVDERGLVSEFIEAPPAPYAINGGIYVFSAAILDLLPDKGDHERSTFPLLAQQGRLAGFPIKGYWRAIDTAKDIRDAGRDLSADCA